MARERPKSPTMASLFLRSHKISDISEELPTADFKRKADFKKKEVWSDNDNPEEVLAKLHELEKENKYGELKKESERVLNNLSEVSDNDPYKGKILYYLGSAYIREGDAKRRTVGIAAGPRHSYLEAEKFLQRAITPFSLSALGYLYTVLSLTEEDAQKLDLENQAFAKFEESYKLAPYEVGAKNYARALLYGLGRNKVDLMAGTRILIAIKQVRNLKGVNDLLKYAKNELINLADSSDKFYLLGMIALLSARKDDLAKEKQVESYKESTKYFLKRIKTADNSSEYFESLYYLAMLTLYKKNDYDEIIALNHLRKVIESGDDDLKQEVYSALSKFRAYLQSNPQNPHFLNMLGYLHDQIFFDPKEIGDTNLTQRALKYFEDAHSLLPHNYEIKRNYARALCDVGKKEEAKILLLALRILNDEDKVVNNLLNSFNKNINYLLGLYYFEQNNNTKSIEHLTLVIAEYETSKELPQEYYDANYHLALLEVNEQNKAIECLKTAAKSPDDVVKSKSYFTLATIYLLDKSPLADNYYLSAAQSGSAEASKIINNNPEILIRYLARAILKKYNLDDKKIPKDLVSLLERELFESGSIKLNEKASEIVKNAENESDFLKTIKLEPKSDVYSSNDKSLNSQPKQAWNSLNTNNLNENNTNLTERLNGLVWDRVGTEFFCATVEENSYLETAV